MVATIKLNDPWGLLPSEFRIEIERPLTDGGQYEIRVGPDDVAPNGLRAGVYLDGEFFSPAAVSLAGRD